MINTECKQSSLEKAKKAALLAGEYLLERTGVVETVSGSHDTKLIADTEAERLIFEELGDEYATLGEEGGGVIDEALPTWIVDPLDGTVNYSRGLPMACISICLWHNGPLLGVVYDFGRGDMFEGVVGNGAKLNGKKIEVSKIAEKGQSVVLTGFPVGLLEDPDKVSNFISEINSYKKVRLLGSAALSLAYVACGRADIYYEKSINIWDVAAGLALVKSAGGHYDMSGTGLLSVYADNGSLK